MTDTKIDFYLLGEKGWGVLAAIPKSYYKIINTVVVGRDSGVADDCADKILKFCRDNNIYHAERESQEGATSTARYTFAIGWRWMLDIQPSKLIVIHDSLLPKYRGFNPLVSALINGDSELGATAIFGSAGYDEGEIILQKQVGITYPIVISDALKIVSNLYINIVLELLLKISNDDVLISYVQDESCATYSLWRSDKDYYVDWSSSAQEVERFINAVGSPYDGAKAMLNGEPVIIRRAIALKDVVISNRKSAIGKVIFTRENMPVIVCKEGLLKILTLCKIDGASLLPLEKFRSKFS